MTQTTPKILKRPTQEMIDAIYAALDLIAPPIASLKTVTIELRQGAIEIFEDKFVLEAGDAKR